MHAPGLPAVFRGAMALLSVAIVGGGLFFALRGEGSGAEVSPAAIESTSTAMVPTLPATATQPVERTLQSTPPDAADTEPTTETSPPASAVSAPQPTRPAVVAPVPTPTIASAPVAGTDLPKYRDVQVLAMAADAVLPSGKTFRQCVEAPPSTERWPAPVHLYYEGRGKWLVETHLSEVQVVFDEASGTFSPRNFAPPNEGCR